MQNHPTPGHFAGHNPPRVPVDFPPEFLSPAPVTRHLGFLLPLVILFFGVISAAAEVHLARFTGLSLEELGAIQITSVSKREEPLRDAMAAAVVVSGEEIIRSGFTSVPEALRLVPGLSVASVNSNEWAISSRGFNGVYANKLLVMVDGRAVYSPLFGGVHWDLQQLVIEDIDRIEVIRGPGGTLWGANSTNGVINIVTKSARDTQGTLITGGAGDVERMMTSVRHGGQWGEDTWFRVYSDYHARGNYLRPDGSDAGDRWSGASHGFRLDRHPDPDTHVVWQTGATFLDLNAGDSDARNAHTLARVSREVGNGSRWEAQLYFDQIHRDERDRLQATVNTWDVSLQNHLEWSDEQETIWGGGFRHQTNRLSETHPSIAIRNRRFNHSLVNIFAQHQITPMPDRLAFTGGVKLEHNDFTGVEWQPSLRAKVKPSDSQTFWGAVSRSVRTPGGIEGADLLAIDAGSPFTGPDGNLYVPKIVGNPNANAEVLHAFETGYRFHPTPRWQLDAAVFHNDYRDLINVHGFTRFEPGNPGTAEMAFANLLDAYSQGGEIALTTAVSDELRLTASYSFLYVNVSGPPGLDTANLSRGSPRHQAALRSSFDFTTRATADAQFRFVDNLFNTRSYLTADLRLAYRPTEWIEFSLVGQNLFGSQHRERGSEPLLPSTSEVPRGFYGKLSWSF